ncbi:MAG: radical SAM protein, partial [Propionibacteriaceae bacterium]|nr:radical SAM protein [Propionibacteriaceae bacterium]
MAESSFNIRMAGERARRPPKHWFDMDIAERQQAVIGLGLPKFRAGQLDNQLFARHNPDSSQWTDVPKAARETLATLAPRLLTPAQTLTADGGSTVKTAWRTFDGSLVESVLMRYPHRDTVCVSSQAGCGMDCPFCATGQNGLKRSLSAAEILAQVFEAAKLSESGQLPGGKGRLSNIVFMGMGEPLANFRAVEHALRVITEPQPHGFGIGARNITVSTVGLVPSIKRLADTGLQVTLAVSLHAPDDPLRDELCPINKRIPIKD